MNTVFVNNIIIVGFPGGGKTFVMMYIVNQVNVGARAVTRLVTWMYAH